MKRQRSLAGLLAAAYVLLVVYASLYPFTGWRWPSSAVWTELLLEWPRWRNRTDEWANLIGYAPLGLLWFAAVARHGGTVRFALWTAVLGPAALSYGLELVQHTVPGRFPSLRDWLNNTLGAAAGAALGGLAQAVGAFDHWQRVRERWVLPGSSGALFLLVTWPMALLFPSPVALGLGRGWSDVIDAVGALAATLHGDAVAPSGVPSGALPLALPVELESLATACGLLAPCCLLAGVVAPGWRRVLLSASAAALAAGTVTLATALNFGPDHAWAWLTPAAAGAMTAALGATVLLAGVNPRGAAFVGVIAVAAMVAVLSVAPADPYYAASLVRWEQGRFVRFHGLAQWLAAVWPYLAGGWMLMRAIRSR